MLKFNDRDPLLRLPLQDIRDCFASIFILHDRYLRSNWCIVVITFVLNMYLFNFELIYIQWVIHIPVLLLLVSIACTVLDILSSVLFLIYTAIIECLDYHFLSHLTFSKAFIIRLAGLTLLLKFLSQYSQLVDLPAGMLWPAHCNSWRRILWFLPWNFCLGSDRQYKILGHVRPWYFPFSMCPVTSASLKNVKYDHTCKKAWNTVNYS